MAIPQVERSRLVDAMITFDSERRQSQDWKEWENNENYKYAIVSEGRLYPVKEIIASAAGVPISSFSGGPESNEYVRKLNFDVVPLQLPPETEVRYALHDLLLSRAPEAIDPSDAYQTLADHFKLPPRLREKRMENSDENHWQNRVRFARRKLVAANILDPSEHGRWQLAIRHRPAYWIEKSLVKGRPDRSEGENALGRALWSPMRAQNGSDVYRNMRLVQPGDVVLHLTDNLAFTGISVAKTFAMTGMKGVSGTAWSGQRCYRIELQNFTFLEPSLTKDELVSAPSIRDRLAEIRNLHSNLFYDPDLNLHQGGYLTEAPLELIELLNAAYNARWGKPIFPNLPTEVVEHIVVRKTDQEIPKRVWLYAPGGKAMFWDEFRKAGIAAIGWDQAGDLKAIGTVDGVQARLDEVSEEPQSGVNAKQCFDFAQTMQPGDWIFAKKGRTEIIGWGIITSEYRFDEGREYFRHVRDVDWQKVGSWATGETRMLSMKTVTEITGDATLVDELEQLVELVTPAEPSPEIKAPPYSHEEFSAETGIQQQVIRSWETRLKRKQHIIFQGPPGTGKTFVAEKMARLLIGDAFGFTETVQFHPSYSYEDFMQGIRPSLADGQLTFRRAPGRFLEFCERARKIDEDSPCVLIIDEINRGNLSRVFGELMYLLEYRDRAIPLAGDERTFSIPLNVFIIGTMNTADRSIALVDHAFRRRFSFIHLGPDYEVLQGQLIKYGLPGDGVVKALKAVNAAIEDRNYEVGISFFLKDGAALALALQDIWEGEIEPYLEEYFYDQPDVIEPLRWKKLAEGPLATFKTGSEVDAR